MAAFLTPNQISKIKEIAKRIGIKWDQSEIQDLTVWRAMEQLMEEIDDLKDKIKRLENKN